MKTIIIKPLISELNADYLDFFDNRAFTDDNPNGPCYCTSPNQDEESIKQMVNEFKIFGVKETVRKYAVKMLNENRIQGYLAYDGDLSMIEFVMMQKQKDMLLLKDMLNFLMDAMSLIIKALFDFIRKLDLLKLQGKMGKLSCERFYYITIVE